MDVIALANRIPSMIFGTKSDDDLSDRLCYRYTVALLLLFAVVITTRQFGSETIKCWVPAHFTSNYEQYASQICWISNTYYTDPNEHIPKEEMERRRNEIKYYQWVSFLLLFQAFMFYSPRILWRTASTRSGLDMSDLVEAANNYKSADKFDNRKKYMDYLVTNIDQYVDDKRRYDNQRKINIIKKCLYQVIPCAGRFLGNYIIGLYFVVKIIYIVNTFIQAYILSLILGRNFFKFGLEFLLKITSGQGWVIESRYFPKVAYCDFFIREWGNPNKSHRYTVQCVLPINLFNQQIFIIIWFWYFLVFVWNIADLFKWIIRSLPNKSEGFIIRRIKLFDEPFAELYDRSSKQTKRSNHFIGEYLEPDGMFMIRIIANNSSDFVATDLIQELWKKHFKKHGNKFNDEEEEDNNETIRQQPPPPPPLTLKHHQSEPKFPQVNKNQNYEFLNSPNTSYDADNDNNNNNDNDNNAASQNRRISKQTCPNIQQNSQYFGVDTNNQNLQYSSRIVDDETTPFTTELVNENKNLNTNKNLLNRKRDAGNTNFNTSSTKV